MGDPADKAPDPKALEVKYTYKDAAKDDAAIKKVETAIEVAFPGAYVSGLADKANNAPISKEEYEAQTKEAREKEAEERRLHPDDVKKEEKESPPGNPLSGVAVHPTVNKPNPPTTGPKEPAKGAKGEAQKAPGKVAAPDKPGAEPALTPPQEVVLAAGASGEPDVDKWLNEYPHKSTETTERLSKIKEMGSIARGFDGQVEKYVANGTGGWESAKGGLVNFLGKKEMGAAFGENPYAKVEGGLGTIMRGLSRFQNVVSVVGNVCGKIGMVLTIVGLLGMILPPLGAAVSAVARVLNVIGIVCDAIGFALSGILTGLNGVVLAKQIGKGASNEEKAATADMMMTEATSAGSHVMSLAMSYGPGFMKGFKNASQGVIGQLFQRFKGAVGKFAAKTLGPVANWAKNIGYKMGIGLEKTAGEGLLSKAWKSPGTLLEKVRGTKLVTSINESRFMQGLEAKTSRLNNIGWVNKVDGLGEKMGEKVGNWQGKGTMESKKFDALVAATEAETALAIEHNAAKNAGNRERAKIDSEISHNREVGNNEWVDHRDEAGNVPEVNARRSDAAYARADELEKNEAQSVSKAEQEGAEEAKHRRQEKNEEKQEEKKKAIEEDKLKTEFNKDPNSFQAETNVMERQRQYTKDRLKDPNLSADERKQVEAEAAKLRHEVDERRLIAVKAGGGESPETLKDMFKQGKEGWAALHWKDEKGEKLESYNKHIENYKGGHADTEKAERAEHQEQIGEWANEDCKVEEPGVYEHVEGMLDGLDEGADEHEHEGDENEHEGPANDDGKDASFEPMMSMGPDVSSPNAAPPMSVNEPQATDAAGPANEPAAPAMAAVPSPGPAPGPAPASAPNDEDKAADVPELVYWPNLIGDKGDFTQGTKELFRMKQIAYAFQKSQIEARRKALETVATLAKSSEDANLKQAHAMDHSVGINGTIEEATKAGSAADHGTQQADAGQKQQDTGHANSNSGNQPKPDPGEKPSRWHPIKRLWWYVKKWASDKAASVFGWIQDQIASLVLRGLCGVSMQDMRNYTTALHHRMEFSKLVGQQGQGKATETMNAALSAKTSAKSYSDQALDDAKACDQNVIDATTFIGDVQQTEDDVAKQQEAAKQFLADMRSAVAAERAKKKEEQLKQAADAAKGTQQGAPTAATAPAAAVAAAPAPTRRPKQKKPPKDGKAISAKAVTKVQNAASYVSQRAPGVLQQITNQREELASKLRTKMENKKAAQPIIAKLKTGENIVAEVQAQTQQVTAEMGNVNSMSPADASALHSSASTVKSQARKLDELSKDAHEKLNYAFKLTYDKIAKVPNIAGYV